MKMKKMIIILLLAASTAPAFAVFSPTFEKQTKGEFLSPAMIAEVSDETPFAFDLRAGSDIDALGFLAAPAGTLAGKPARALANHLAGRSLSFWQDNPQLVQVFTSLDDNFPKDTGDQYYLASIRNYFATTFLSNDYGDARRAYAVANSLPLVQAYPYDPYRILGGDMYLSLEMYGGRIKNGFGWNWDVNMDYDGASSLLGTMGNRMSVDARANIAYAVPVGERFSLGISAQPMLRFQMDIPNEAFISARMNDDILYIFTGDLMFGTGVSINIGASYKVDNSLSFALNFRNIPSFRNYVLLPVSGIAEGNISFSEDDTIYFVPPDIALSAFWDRDRYHLHVEAGDILNQVIYDRYVTERRFDYYSIIKLSFAYDLSNNLALTAGYRYRAVFLGIRYNGMEAGISTKLDRAAIGLDFGWKF